jgi:hypothetical protein
MSKEKLEIVPLNSGILNGISLEELEDRLEMQMLGLLDAFALAGVETTNCPTVKVTVPQPT